VHNIVLEVMSRMHVHYLMMLCYVFVHARFDAAGVTIIDFPDGTREGVRGVVRTQNYTAHLGR
jgi:hypothetical protein